MLNFEKQTRRFLIKGMVALFGSSVLSSKVAAAVKSPRAAEGPFYPVLSMRMPDIDNDLVKIAGLVEEAGGEIFTLRGTIKDSAGRLLVGHRIEIWQCDMNGKYLHPGDDRNVPYDQKFQGFGHDVTDEGGNYVFRTIIPTIYPGRSPHIHVKVIDGEREILTTQFYLKDHPDNERDGLFSYMSKEEADSVSMVIVESESGAEARINLVI